MPAQLHFKRLRFSKQADTWLRTLKGRTGVTPNILCRLGICLSLAEEGDPRARSRGEDSDREINRVTLLGNHELVFAALLRERHADELADDDSLDELLIAHAHRGIRLLAGRAKTLSELGMLFEASVEIDDTKTVEEG